MDLTKTFSHEQFVRTLESWAWVGVGGLGPAFRLVPQLFVLHLEFGTSVAD